MKEEKTVYYITFLPKETEKNMKMDNRSQLIKRRKKDNRMIHKTRNATKIKLHHVYCHGWWKPLL